ncbi:hypothetical protein [Tautonia plasticadhaerens]|uniref:Uncharacterized protein n=1 Tax=Tautonia plasticadhaerens TaxID=2527974 RepID=A0A518HCM3_9BACT|nr:hypothetical protein [Tautonia plasticadhaerens]QDV38396.1 hypothetical protein ElP_63510 [Tautonia plasticadhaerens]
MTRPEPRRPSRTLGAATAPSPGLRGLHPAEALAVAQGAYYAATGLWALLDVDSFQEVTGPKVDVWLVKTVGALVTATGGAIGLAGARRRVTPEIELLAAGSALGLAAIDVYYVARGRIAPIYLADAVAELGLAAAWALVRGPGQGRRASR